jgi:hypothetical protein
MTRNLHPGVFGLVSGGLKAIISGGVVYSLPWQNGQNPPFFLWEEGEIKSVGLLPLSIEIITQRPVIGSLLSSDTYHPLD